MKAYKFFIVLICLLVFIVSGYGIAGSSDDPDYVPDEVLVKFKKQVSVQWKTNEERKKGVESEAAKVGIRSRLKKSILLKNIHNIKILDRTISVKQAIEKLKSNPNVEYAEPNYIYKINFTSNDPFLNQLWGLNNTGQTGGTADADIDAVEAWDIQRGSQNIVVAVIDTGVDYTHEDLSANMWINPFETLDGVDNDLNGYVDDIYGINSITGSGNPMDDNGHGTHVSGTIGAVGNNGKGISGVTHNVKIMALKFLDSSGSGTTLDAIECIQYMIDMKNRGINIKASNNSWGGGGYSQFLYDAINSLKNNNILFSAAAGNSSSDNDSKPFYPASYNLENIISVAATDHNDSLASFSNYGVVSVDVAAPGVNILSTLPGGGYTPKNDDAFFDNMESGASNWSAQPSWAITAEQNYTSGERYSWSDSPYSRYANYTDRSLTSNPLNLSSITADLRLGFWIRGRLETHYDFLYIEMSGDSSSWLTIGSITGNMPGWTLKTYSIPEELRTSDFRFRFRLYTDHSIVYDGVYIDNIGIGINSGSNSYGTYSGTSMAAPHVAGLVALIGSKFQDYTYLDIKNTIFNSVDPKSSLSGKVLTGGRINAYNALTLTSPPPLTIPAAPTNLTAKAVSNSRIDLSWKDNSDNENGFKVERRTATGSYVEIAAVGPNVTTFSDTGLARRTTYYYRVRAYNVAGYSSYSNEASARTRP